MHRENNTSSSAPSPALPPQPGSTSWLERLAQIILAVATLWAIGKVIGHLAPVLMPVIISLLVAYILDPLIDRFERRGISRWLAITFLFVLVLSAIGFLTAIVGPILVEQIVAALQMLPGWARENYEKLDAFLHDRFDIALESRFEDIATFVATRAESVISGVAEASMSSVGTVLNAVIIPIFTFYFLRDFDTLKRLPLRFVPLRYHARVEERATRMDALVGEWIRGQVQVALILAVLYAIGLSIAGVRLGFAIGIVVGLLNVVPYLGAILGFSLSVLMALIYGGNVMGELIGIGVVFAVVQGLEGYLITPRLVGEKVGMSPLTVMIVLLLGGSLFGFFGLLLSIPCVAAGSVLFHDLVDWYRQSSFYQRAAAQPIGARQTGQTTQPFVAADMQAFADAPEAPPAAVAAPNEPSVPNLNADEIASPASPASTASTASTEAPPVGTAPSPTNEDETKH